MADSYVQVPPDSTGKKLDGEQLTVGANTVLRERDQIAGRAADEISDVRGTDADGGADYGLVVRPAVVCNPVSDQGSVTLASSASGSIDGTMIASSKTGKLMGVTVASTAALCKFVIIAKDGGVETTIATVFTSQVRPTFTYAPADKRYTELPYVGGDEQFRVTATNLDPANSATAYATIEWDEV